MAQVSVAGPVAERFKLFVVDNRDGAKVEDYAGQLIYEAAQEIATRAGFRRLHPLIDTQFGKGKPGKINYTRSPMMSDLSEDIKGRHDVPSSVQVAKECVYQALIEKGVLVIDGDVLKIIE